MMLGKLDRYMQQMKIDHFLTPYIKTNSKWIENLNKVPETHKHSRRKLRKIFEIALSNIISDMFPWAWKTKEKMNKEDYIKLKSFCTAKKTINKMKRWPTE